MENAPENEELGEVQYPIAFQRLPFKTSGPCVHCVEEPEKEPRLYLMITFQSDDITLCPEHEGELLLKLLTNYVKRKEKGSKEGFCAHLPKDAEDTIIESDGALWAFEGGCE